jgi:hypothetical protein
MLRFVFVIPGRLNAYLIYNYIQDYFNILDVTLDVENDYPIYQRIRKLYFH